MFVRGLQHVSFSVWRSLRRFAHTSAKGHHHPGGNTIFALSSAPGKAGVAMLRISGSKAAEAIRQIAKMRALPPARTATLRRLYKPGTQEAIDRGLVLWFPGPSSFTGEHCVEFHVHGGSAVVAAMVTALAELEGFCPAEPGEFTKRAFLNGKLDLTEVEGMADLIESETESQRKQALRQMEGDLSRMYTEWRQALIKCLANVEAFIDFGEEENIEEDVIEQVEMRLRGLKAAIESHLSDSRQGERLRSGVQVAILGPPNVGKSSLLNALCRRPAAIVSPIAGTTRDVVETAVNIGGYPVVLSDTAGLRDTVDAIEREGVRRALSRAEQADLRIVLVDGDSSFPGDLTTAGLTRHVQGYLQEMRLGSDATNSSGHGTEKTGQGSPSKIENTLLVINKSDLMSDADREKFEQFCAESRSLPVCLLSCMTGQGMDRFVETLQHQVKNMCGNPLSGCPSLTQARHRTHLSQCLQQLSQYMEQHSQDVVLAAEHLRKASNELGKVIGKISTEDVLDVIFSDFCIGK